ncbi:hypothetical protein KIW84_072051 [Lathyrus oleraceus]|uniref:Uncharacterized protein n=1 Tax=Pisum sativum TaxID=3888 RepID=A0A9D4VK24_PEA|nr:hypothetical protein KIW84_072051 [Pisum sativum]
MTDAEWIQSRYDPLNLIEEKRLTAMCHGQLYQQRMKKAFDKKVKPRVFREGDLVLKKVLSFAPDSRGKWTPNYEGPYVVKRAFSGGALMLTTMDGEDFTRPVNSDAIFVKVVPQTELLLGLFPSTVASRMLLKTSFSPAAVPPAWVFSFASRAVINIPTRVASGVVTAFPHAVCQQELPVSSARLFSFEDSPTVFPSRVAYAVRFYLDDIILPQWVIPQQSYMEFASTAVLARAYAPPFVSQLTLGSPAYTLGLLLFPYRFVLVAASARCDFLYPDWVVSRYLWFSASSAVLADLCFSAYRSPQIGSPAGFSPGSIIPDVWFLNLFVLELSVLSAFIKHKSRIFMHIHKTFRYSCCISCHISFVCRVSCYGDIDLFTDLPKQMLGVINLSI